MSPANARKSAVRGAKAAGKAAKQAVPPAARRGSMPSSIHLPILPPSSLTSAVVLWNSNAHML